MDVLDLVMDMDLDDQMDTVRAIADNPALDIDTRESSSEKDITDKQRSLAIEITELGAALERKTRMYYDAVAKKL